MTSFVYRNSNIKFTNKCEQNVDKLTFLKSNYKYKRRYQHKQHKKQFPHATEMQKKCKKMQKVTNHCCRKNYGNAINKNTFSRISRLFFIIIVNLMQSKSSKKNNSNNKCKKNNNMNCKVNENQVHLFEKTTVNVEEEEEHQQQLQILITDIKNDDDGVDGVNNNNNNNNNNKWNINCNNDSEIVANVDAVIDIDVQNVHTIYADADVTAYPVAYSVVNLTNRSFISNDDVNVDVDEINIQQNYDKVSTHMRCQHPTTTQRIAIVANNTLTTTTTTTATPSTATTVTATSIAKNAHMQRHHWIMKQKQNCLRWQHECNSIFISKSFNNTNNNKIKSSYSSSNNNNKHSNINININSKSNNSNINSNITNSISDFSTHATNRRLPTDCGYRGNLLSILLTLFIALALGTQTAQAGACWRNLLDNSKCNSIFSLNITKSECCGANQEFSYTDRELTSVEYFFATTIGGGMECKPCIDNCNNVKCGPNKKCIKRKGRLKCICAPECGAAARHHKRKGKIYRGHKHHTTINQNIHTIETAGIITRDDSGFRDCIGVSGSGSGSCSDLLYEKSPRDIRSLSSEITNLNLGLEGVLHHNHNQRNPSQQKPQIIKREPKSGRLYITANVVNKDKPTISTTTTHRLQIFSNVAPMINKNNNKNKNKNNNKNNNDRKIQEENQREYRNGSRRYKSNATAALSAESQTAATTRTMTRTTTATLLKETERGFTMSRHKLNRYKNRNDYELTKNQQQELHGRVRHVRVQKHQRQHQHQHQQKHQHQHQNQQQKHENVQNLHEHEIVEHFENAPNHEEVENKYNHERHQQPYEHKRKYNKNKLRDHNANMNNMQTTMKLPSSTSNSSLATTLSSSVAAIKNLTTSTSVYNATKTIITTTAKAATNLTIATLQTTPANSILSADRRLLNHGSNTATSSLLSSLTSLSSLSSSSSPAAATATLTEISSSSSSNQHVHHPVCGSDGRTYNSECQLKKRACRTDNPELKVAYRGHCKTTCNGVKCLNGLTCVEDHYTIPYCIACKIDCPQDDQNDVIDPSRAVCGIDGKTYKSTCDINRMICKVGRSIAVAYPGPCRVDSVTCNNINCGPKKTCLVDLLTHEPRCVSCRYKCQRNRQRNSYFGQDNKICGVNQRTYNSWCEILKDSCRTGFFIDVKSAGECKTNKFLV